jgi:hypothetical protein
MGWPERSVASRAGYAFNSSLILIAPSDLLFARSSQMIIVRLSRGGLSLLPGRDAHIGIARRFT